MQIEMVQLFITCAGLSCVVIKLTKRKLGQGPRLKQLPCHKDGVGNNNFLFKKWHGLRTCLLPVNILRERSQR